MEIIYRCSECQEILEATKVTHDYHNDIIVEFVPCGACVAKLDSTISELKEKNDILNEKISELDDDIDALKYEIKSLQVENESLAGEAESLRMELPTN